MAWLYARDIEIRSTSKLLEAVLSGNVLESLLAMFLPHPIYLKWEKRARSRRIMRFISFLDKKFPALQLRVLDIGAWGGPGSFGYRELSNLKNLYIAGVEPQEAAAEELRKGSLHRPYNDVKVVGVADFTGRANLNITECIGCTSLREPLVEEIKNYYVSDWFKKVKTVEVPVTTVEALFSSEAFDFCKIDVQGYDFEVLAASRDFFSRTTAVTLECQLTPFYRDQGLLPEVHKLMTELGFRLIMLDNVAHFYDGEVVEINCGYIKTPDLISSKEDLIKRITFAIMNDNSLYVGFLLRNFASPLLDEDTIDQIYALSGAPKRLGKFPIPDSMHVDSYSKGKHGHSK